MFIEQIIAITEQKMREAALVYPKNTALRNCLKNIDGVDASRQRIPAGNRDSQTQYTYPSVSSPDTRRRAKSPSKRSKTPVARRSSTKTQAGKRRK